MGRRFISRIFLYLREYFYTSHKSSLSRARAHAHIKHHFFVRARPTCARKSQTLLSSIDLSIDDRGWKVGSSFLHRLLFLLEMHKSSVFFLYLWKVKMADEWKDAAKERTKVVRVRGVLTRAGEFLPFFSRSFLCRRCISSWKKKSTTTSYGKSKLSGSLTRSKASSSFFFDFFFRKQRSNCTGSIIAHIKTHIILGPPSSVNSKQ